MNPFILVFLLLFSVSVSAQSESIVDFDYSSQSLNVENDDTTGLIILHFSQFISDSIKLQYSLVDNVSGNTLREISQLPMLSDNKYFIPGLYSTLISFPNCRIEFMLPDSDIRIVNLSKLSGNE